MKAPDAAQLRIDKNIEKDDSVDKRSWKSRNEATSVENFIEKGGRLDEDEAEDNEGVGELDLELSALELALDDADGRRCDVRPCAAMQPSCHAPTNNPP